MDDVITEIESGGSADRKWPNTHAVKFGPYREPVRIELRAYSNHHQGNGSSTAWMKLYYDGDEVGSHNGTGDPIPLQIAYYVYLETGTGASFRLDTSNKISTIRDFGFEATFQRA